MNAGRTGANPGNTPRHLQGPTFDPQTGLVSGTVELSLPPEDPEDERDLDDEERA